MAYRIHLISQNAASAAVLAAVLARLHHLVTVVAPTQVVAQDADLFLLDGSENVSGLLAALSDAPGWDRAAHVPRLIALNDAALIGAAVLAQFDIDGCVLLPVHEQILALHIDTLMKGATQLHRLRTVWPAGMPPPTVPMAPAQILILDDDGYTAQRCAGAVTAVDALAETVPGQAGRRTAKTARQTSSWPAHRRVRWGRWPCAPCPPTRGSTGRTRAWCWSPIKTLGRRDCGGQRPQIFTVFGKTVQRAAPAVCRGAHAHASADHRGLSHRHSQPKRNRQPG